MLTFYRKYWKTAFDIALLLLTVYLIMFAFSYFYRIATPIIFALFIYVIIEPLAKFLNRRGIKKSFASAISIMLFTLIIIGIFVGAGALLTVQVTSLIDQLPDYTHSLEKEITSQVDRAQKQMEGLPPDLADKINESVDVATDKLSDLGTTILRSLLRWLTSFSAFMLNLVVAVILAYFLSVEIDTWKRLAGDKTPRTFKQAFFFLRENVLIGIMKYLRAQVILVTITFVTILMGLIVLQVRNAFTIALFAAIFDVLPLLGITTFFFPWIAYLFIVGDTKLGITLSVLAVIVLLMRQILEPKITGDSLGVSAFTMLSFMVISLSLFGVAGLILSPVLIILLKALHEQGYLKRWIRAPEGEYDK